MGRVIIIGGGPAAASFAATLLRSAPRGAFEVIIVEAKVFPRRKVCGEFISPAATTELTALIDEPTLSAAGARQVRTLVLECGTRTTHWPLPTPAWTLSRFTLDDLLLKRAQAAGASLLQPATVTSVSYSDHGCTVTLADATRLVADLIVHADGCGRHDPAGRTPSRRGVVALKCSLSALSPLDGLHMRSFKGAYAGAVQADAGLITVALVARASLLRTGAGSDDLLRRLWPAFDPADRQTPWLSCGVPGSKFIPSGHARSFRIGNAAAAVEPVGGEGIGLALWSGALLGRLLSSVETPRAETLQSVHDRYAHAYRRCLRTRRPACRLAAEALMRPWLVQPLWPLLRRPRVGILPWYRLTGKPARPHPVTG